MFEQVDWYTLFAPQTPLLETFIRGTAIYLGLFLMLRIILKRESGTLGITDMLLVALIADAAQNGMADDYHSVTDGLLLVGVIIFWSYFLNWLGYKSPLFQKLLKPRKLLLVKDGRMIRENMRRELITTGELMSEVRANGLTDLSKVKRAYMEPTGLISIIVEDEKPTNSPRERKLP
jgi:uncharacterized membrane protein YcaP (DUF421 family)